MSDGLFGSIYRSQSGSSGGGNTFNPRQVMLNTMGQQITMDWMMKAVLDGAAFHVRAGNLTTPLAGDGTAITDTAAEMAADAATGTTIIPIETQTTIAVLTADASAGATKSFPAVSTSGAAYTPQPLRSGGPASTATARVAATGATTVTAEVAGTTLRLHQWENEEGGTPGTDIVGPSEQLYRPIAAPILPGPNSLYLQVAVCTYYAHIDFIELDSDVIAR